MAIEQDHVRVLIVGGGLAGLLCALECHEHGFKTTLLESRDIIQSGGAY